MSGAEVGNLKKPTDNYSAVKARAALAEVAEYLGMKRSPTGHYHCPSPLHEDNTPSLFLNNSTFKCFGCGARGDVFDLVSLAKNCGKHDALLYVANIYGVKLKGGCRDVEAREVLQKNFKRQLKPGGKEWGYLTQRGYKEEDIKAMELGACPSRSWLSRYQRLTEGLALPKALGKSHTLTIPHWDARGLLDGWLLRDISNADPKYTCTPGLKRGDLFLGHLLTPGLAILVEGELDALYARSQGLKNVVACGSAHLSDSHLQQLINKRITRAGIMFDGDDAGRKGALQALKHIWLHSRIVPILFSLSEGEDPDSVIRAKGIGHVYKLIKDADTHAKKLGRVARVYIKELVEPYTEELR